MAALRWVIAIYVGVIRHFYKLAALCAVILGCLFAVIYLLQDYLIYLAILFTLFIVARVFVWFRMQRW